MTGRTRHGTRSSRLGPHDAASASRAQNGEAGTRRPPDPYGPNPKTVAKWRRRTTTADQPMGSTWPRTSARTETEDASLVEFRCRTLLPLDNVLGCRRATIPKLSRRAPPLPRPSWHLPPVPRRGASVQARALSQDQDRLRPPRHRRATPDA